MKRKIERMSNADVLAEVSTEESLALIAERKRLLAEISKHQNIIDGLELELATADRWLADFCKEARTELALLETERALNAAAKKINPNALKIEVI